MFTTWTTIRKLRICVIFDADANARNAEIVIGSVLPGHECELQLLGFDELSGPACAIDAARNAAEADMLLLAIHGDRVLPSHVRMWLGLCLGLRDRDCAGALAVLITQPTGSKELDASLIDYLETVAIIGGLSFL